MAEPMAELELVSEPRGKRFAVTARHTGNVVHRNILDPVSEKQRRKFITAVRARVPDADPAALDAELLKLSPPGPAPTRADSDREVDALSVVRPELFHTPAVSGVTVPVTTETAGGLATRWRTYLRWADGRRGVTDLPDHLVLPGGGRLWLRPVPGDPGGRGVAWSSVARREWTGGRPAQDPADLFRRVCTRIAQFIDFPQDVAPGTTATVALWVILTYLYPAWDAVPYLYVGGPMGSGKSRLLDVLARLAFRPAVTSNLTVAAMFRTLHDRGGVLIYDEAERLGQNTPDAADLTAMFLAGYRRGGKATRMEAVGDAFRTVEFDVFGPKAVACIAGLPPTLASRAITVMMFRTGSGADKPKRRIDADPAAWAALRDDLHALALDHGRTALDLAGQADVCPTDIHGRNYELWQPLLALARWVESHGAEGLLALVRQHAVEGVRAAREDAVPEADEILLSELARAVGNGENLKPSELLARARERDDVTFKSWTASSVTRRLKNYRIGPAIKSGGERRYKGVSLRTLGLIQERYGIDLGSLPVGENGRTAPTASDPAPDSTAPATVPLPPGR